MMSPPTPLSVSEARPGRHRYLFWILLGSVVALILGTCFYLWLVLLSPYGYHPPEDLPPIDPEREHWVFVYGTLRNPLVRWLVIGRTADPEPAVLPGYRKEGLDIAPQPGASTEGLVFEVSARELARLDRYERMGIRYERIELRLRNKRHAWVYRRLAEN